MFTKEIGRTMDWGEYDVDAVTPTDNRMEDLAEAIEVQWDITWIFLHRQIWGSIKPHTLFKS